MPTNNPYQKDALKTVFWLGFLTGSLDAIAALLLSNGISPEIIFKFIASGYFGKAAFNGGVEMAVAGIVFHYLIAYLFTLFCYLTYPSFKNILRNKYLIGFVYGVLIWLIMNLLVIPYTPIGVFTVKAITVVKGVVALIICIGLPVVIVADKKINKTSL